MVVLDWACCVQLVKQSTGAKCMLKIMMNENFSRSEGSQIFCLGLVELTPVVPVS